MKHPWHSLSQERLFAVLGSSLNGLAKTEAVRRLAVYGINALPEGKHRTVFEIFLSQFASPLVLILIAAAAVVFLMGETVDAAIVSFVLVFNAIVGTIQEGKAQNTLGALKRYVETTATVYRDGEEIIIPDTDVVPGDLLVVREGEKIPADARIIWVAGLKTDEASLTGESEPVEKTDEVINRENLPTAEAVNMLFRGTYAVTGRARAVAVATGTKTVIGKLAREIADIDSEIPLQANIRALSRAIVAVVFVMASALFAGGIALGQPARTMFSTVVSLAVSVIPEGLPIVMTLVLAAGVWRMSRRNALVKKLQAVEALGQARVIAVDKTGTLTRNELVIRLAWADNRLFEIEGTGYDPAGRVFEGPVEISAQDPVARLLGEIGGLCATAQVSYSPSEKQWRVSGDPTEAAMLVFSRKLGFREGDLLASKPLIKDIPFRHDVKFHAIIHGTEADNVLTVLGAPESVLARCDTVFSASGTRELDTRTREQIEATMHDISGRGLRTIAIATRRNTALEIEPGKIGGLTFVGFFGMQDALRPEAKESVALARSAGIKVVMITGDHRVTARAIAAEVGIYREGDDVVVGTEIDEMTDAQVARAVASASVFARVTPEHKLRIIKAFKDRGEIVAMTGDGVNDAPSLVAADLGVAMGRIGTEVAKEASDIVLLDDNFASIVAAIEEGRSIYKTIKKVILYLFSTSAGEVATITGALVLGYPLPLLPAQIIWLNFVTDGFLDVALAMEPKEKGLLSGNFERPKKYLVDRLMLVRMAFMAVPMMLGTLFVFGEYVVRDPAKAWTMSLTVLAAFQWFNAWNCRSDKESVFRLNPLSNPYLVGATMIVIVLQIAAVYHPFLQGILNTRPLTGVEWVSAILIASSILFAEESRKLFFRREERLRV